MTEFEACYIFDPSEDGLASQRPAKRRKTGPVTSLPDRIPFAPLLKGKEKPEAIRGRYEAFQTLWLPREAAIDDIINDANRSTVKSVASFILATNLDEFVNPFRVLTALIESRLDGKIPTGLMVAGPESSASTTLFEAVADTVNAEQRTVLVNLTSGQSPNLKTVLKFMNRHATSQDLNAEEGTLDEGDEGGRLLNYDLEILHRSVKSHSIAHVILSFADSEAFDGALLSDLIDVLSSWSDRIPLVLLFGIATSVELFQAKLSRSALRCLWGEQFDVERVDVERIFTAVHDGLHTYRTSSEDGSAPPCNLWLGCMLSKMLMERHRDYIQSPFSFGQALKYAFMTHFFSNPLSLALHPKSLHGFWQPEHAEAIRNLSSFQRYVETSIEDNDLASIRDLLTDDAALKEFVRTGIDNSTKDLQNIVSAVDLLYALQTKLNKQSITWSELYTEAMSGKLADSPLLEATILSLTKAQSPILLDLLSHTLTLFKNLPSDLQHCTTDLTTLLSTTPPTILPLRSAHDHHHKNLRTTIISQKVSLSTQTATLTPPEKTYTKILDRVHTLLQTHLLTHLRHPHSLPFHELLIYDFRIPHRESFSPRPRFALERALSSPRDYLDCDCCAEAGGLEAGLPAVGVLYQLFLESGAVVNTADLWRAFWVVVGGGEGDEEGGGQEEEEEKGRVLALFTRSLAELRYLGLLKGSRKKADHLAKLAWKGL